MQPRNNNEKKNIKVENSEIVTRVSNAGSVHHSAAYDMFVHEFFHFYKVHDFWNPPFECMSV